MTPSYHRRGHQASPILFTLLTLFTMLLSACGGNSQSSTQTNKKHTLTVATQSTSFSLPGFNPYSTSPNYGINGFVYESLEFCNVNNGSYAPLLATDYAWNQDLTQITFHIRQNIKWNDGQPFSAEDVAFTYNAIKQYPAADTSNVWSYLSSVQATNKNTVVMTLQKAYVPALYFIATQVVIIPKHIFASVGDITRYNNATVVGTGPFKVTRWSGYYDENLQKSFVDKDPAHNHYFMDSISQVGISIDLRDPLLGQVAVRKAISTALDRDGFSQQSVAGFEPAVAQHGLVLPASQAYLDPTYATLSTKAQPTVAEQYLKDAGFTKGSDGIYAKRGQRLFFNLISVIGYSDWNAMAQMMQAELKTIGIEITIKLMTEAAFSAFRSSTQSFQLMINNVHGGPSPYYIYYSMLDSQSLPPHGRNDSEWKDAKTDQLLQQLATTADPAKQKEVVQGLEKIMVDQVPYIPVLGGARWCEYTSTRFTGWPSDKSPYSSCAAYIFPDNEYVVLHLQPAAS